MAEEKKDRSKRDQASTMPVWDKRGLFVGSLAASWEAKASASAWRRLVEAVPLQPDSVQDEKDAFPTASCLVMTGPEAGSRRTMIAVHDGSHGKIADSGLADPEVEAHWRLEMWVGRTQATTGATTRNSTVGGYTAALQKMADLWPVPTPLVVSVSSTYLMNPALYRLHPSIPKLNRRRAGISGRNLTAEATMWEVSYKKQTAFITLTCPPSKKAPILIGWSGQLTCNFASDIVAQLDDLVWDTVRFLTVPMKT